MKKLHRGIRIALIIATIFINIGCDQVSKTLVRQQMTYDTAIEVIKPYLVFIKVENTGAFLGLGNQLHGTVGLIFLLLAPALLLSLLCVHLLNNKKLETGYVIAFSSIIGGGIANLLDRFLYGSVTDFMFIDLGWVHSGIFNMADVSITAGFVYLICSRFGNKDLRVKNLE